MLFWIPFWEKSYPLWSTTVWNGRFCRQGNIIRTKVRLCFKASLQSCMRQNNNDQNFYVIIGSIIKCFIIRYFYHLTSPRVLSYYVCTSNTHYSLVSSAHQWRREQGRWIQGRPLPHPALWTTSPGSHTLTSRPSCSVLCASHPPDPRPMSSLVRKKPGCG